MRAAAAPASANMANSSAQHCVENSVLTQQMTRSAEFSELFRLQHPLAHVTIKR